MSQYLEEQMANVMFPVIDGFCAGATLLDVSNMACNLAMSEVPPGVEQQIIVMKKINHRILTEVRQFGLVALLKLEELNMHGQNDVTPVLSKENFSFVTGFMGGVRFENKIVAISGFRQEWDKLLAATLLYAYGRNMVLNHVGRRVDTGYDELLEKIGQNHSFVEANADDHERQYAPVYSNTSLAYMIEVQRFPETTPDSLNIHLDVAVEDPKALLKQLEWAMGYSGQRWENGSPGPVAAISAYSEAKGERLSVHVRNWDDRAWRPEGIAENDFPA